MNAFDIETLHTLLEYNPLTGSLVWRVRSPLLFPNSAAANRWNGRFAGKEAGTLNAKLGYRIIGICGHYLYAHRIAYAMQHGEWPEITDHINGNKTDNRACNLRSVSEAENRRNQSITARNTSGVTGVYWDKVNRKWCAQLCFGGGRKVNLGRFETLEEAAAARKLADREYGFHPNHGRERVA